MGKINIKNLILDSGLSFEEIANRIFPQNKYPQAALTRIVNGEAELSSSQIFALSKVTGKDFNEIFENEWKAKSKKGLHVFTNGEYKAILDIENNITRVYHNSSLFHDSVIYSSNVSVSEYLQSLDKIISKHKSKQ